MTQQNILAAAKQGNPQAISALINRQLQPQGITAKAKLIEGCLQILVESATMPPQNEIVPYVVKGVRGLQVAAIKALVISGRRSGEDLPDWTERVDLEVAEVSIVQQESNLLQTTRQDADQVKCPNCASTQIMAAKKGFEVGKAAAGAVLFGGIGLAGGMIGANKIILSCLRCGHRWEPSQPAITPEIYTERRVTQTKIKIMTMPERIGLSALSFIGLPIVGLIVLIIPIFGWFLYFAIVVMGVLVLPAGLISGDPKYIKSLVGECPHCGKESSTSLSSGSFSCSHCKKQVIIRDRQFYSL